MAMTTTKTTLTRNVSSELLKQPSFWDAGAVTVGMGDGDGQYLPALAAAAAAGSWNFTGQGVPIQNDDCRWSDGAQDQPHVLGCTKTSKTPRLSIIHETASFHRSTGTKKANSGVTNGCAAGYGWPGNVWPPVLSAAK